MGPKFLGTPLPDPNFAGLQLPNEPYKAQGRIYEPQTAEGPGAICGPRAAQGLCALSGQAP